MSLLKRIEKKNQQKPELSGLIPPSPESPEKAAADAGQKSVDQENFSQATQSEIVKKAIALGVPTEVAETLPSMSVEEAMRVIDQYRK